MSRRQARVALLVAGWAFGAAAAAAQERGGAGPDARPAVQPAAARRAGPAAERAAAAAEPASTGRLRVAIDAGAVTVEARDVALRDLLAEFARRTGLRVDDEAALDEPVTLGFERLPARAALDAILRGRNFALRWVEPAAGAGGSIDLRASRLWVFARKPAEGDPAAAGAAAGRPPAAPADPLAGLRPALADGDAGVRLRAVSALIAAGGDEAAAALAALATSDPDPAVREEAVYGLGEAGGEIGREVLQEALGDPVPAVREAAVAAFADLGGRASVTALAAVLGDRDPALREQAVYALGEVGGAAAVRLVRQALADEHGFVREAAAEVLDDLSGR